MHISKHFELLRFYLTEKIGEINNSLKSNVSNEIQNITSAILSALLSLFISNEFITINGLRGVIFRVVFVIAGFLVLDDYVISKFLRFRKTKKEIKNSDEKELSFSEAKNYVDKFDHITCDGILLARDFLSKSKDNKLGINEQQFYLIEAFYYYKKAIVVAELIVQHKAYCVNNQNKKNAIAVYRLINVYNSLIEIDDAISEALKKCDIANKDEFKNDIKLVKENELAIVKAFVEPYIKK